jgi:hypothetical protein
MTKGTRCGRIGGPKAIWFTWEQELYGLIFNHALQANRVRFTALRRMCPARSRILSRRGLLSCLRFLCESVQVNFLSFDFRLPTA